MAERHTMIQQGADYHRILCGEAHIADVFRDATGKHYTRVVDPQANLEPADLAFILERVLHLDSQRHTVQ